MQKSPFIANVGDIRKLFAEYREQLEEALLKSYYIETRVVNRVVELQRMLHEVCNDIEYGTVQNPK